MADIRWIKVAVDMFEDSKIEFIRSLPEGDAIIVTWIQMLSIAGQSNLSGYLMVADGIPYTEQLLCTKLRRQPVFMQFALETLMKLKMIDVEDGPYHITKWEKHQNVEGMEKVRLQTNERVKRHRLKEKQKLETLQSNANVTLQVTHDVTHGNAIEVDKELITTTTTETESVDSIHLKVFGKIIMTPLMQAFIRKIKDEGYTDTYIREIMLEAGESGNNPSIRFMEAIHERWKKERIYTRLEAKNRKNGAPDPTPLPAKKQFEEPKYEPKVVI